MNAADLTYFDLEGAAPVYADCVNPQKARIVQIAVVWQGKKWGSLVNPGFPLPPEFTELTGISDMMLADAPPFVQVAKTAAGVMRREALAGFHILKYDVPLLAREFGMAGIDFPWDGKKLIDFGALYAVKNPRTLNDAYRQYVGRERQIAHDAVYDTMDTAEMAAAMIDAHEDLRNGSLDEMALASNYNKRFADPDRKLAWDGDKLVWNFGKYKNCQVGENPNYTSWVLDGDFPEATKRLIEKYTQGELP